jgi:hypothetical protein
VPDTITRLWYLRKGLLPWRTLAAPTGLGRGSGLQNLTLAKGNVIQSQGKPPDLSLFFPHGSDFVSPGWVSCLLSLFTVMLISWTPGPARSVHFHITQS